MKIYDVVTIAKPWHTGCIFANKEEAVTKANDLRAQGFRAYGPLEREAPEGMASNDLPIMHVMHEDDHQIDLNEFAKHIIGQALSERVKTQGLPTEQIDKVVQIVGEIAKEALSNTGFSEEETNHYCTIAKDGLLNALSDPN